MFDYFLLLFISIDAPIEINSHYKGNSYIELNRSTIAASSNEKELLIAVLFSTTQPNGLLIWYGQNKGESYNGQDFVALALVDGILEYSFRLNSEESLVKSHARVDDNNRHVAILKRNGNQATLEVDGFMTYGESRPTDKKESFIPGSVFIGQFLILHLNTDEILSTSQLNITFMFSILMQQVVLRI